MKFTMPKTHYLVVEMNSSYVYDMSDYLDDKEQVSDWILSALEQNPTNTFRVFEYEPNELDITISDPVPPRVVFI